MRFLSICLKKVWTPILLTVFLMNLKEGLGPSLAKIKESKQPDLSALKGTYDIPAQKKLQELLLSYIGFDFSMGAVAESEHPSQQALAPEMCVSQTTSVRTILLRLFSAQSMKEDTQFLTRIFPCL